MKKFIMFISLLLIGFGLQAQSPGKLNFTPTTNDSIVNAGTKYCTLSAPITGMYAYSISVYLTHSLGSTDSTQVTIEGSNNNSDWYKLTYLGTPMLAGGAIYRTASVMAKIGTTSGGWLFVPTWYITPGYLRVKVHHYATGSVKITRANIFLHK